jgi:prepilin-type N-terminal cleavage/methylation domain-containing protein
LRGAFTLIELLAVMAIILILAGLVLAIAGHANYKAATARAQGEIQAFSAALESYKTDNGAYPRSTDTDTLNANSTDPLNVNPGSGTSNYQKAGMILFQALSGYPATTGGTYSKTYYTFNASQMSPSPSPPATTTYVTDPFGLPYGYSTANLADQDKVSAGATPSPTAGYNPTFDLWSTGGYSSPGGKAYPTSPVPTPAPNTYWIKNW